MDEPEKGEPVTPCMDVYKENIQCDGSLDKLKLIFLKPASLINHSINSSADNFPELVIPYIYSVTARLFQNKFNILNNSLNTYCPTSQIPYS